MSIAHLPSRALIRVTGDDKDTFLQGLITNDIHKLEAQKAIYACLLTPQGKYLYDFFIAKDGASYLIDCEMESRDDLLKKLRLHKLRSQVALEKAEGQVYALWGDEEMPSSVFQDPRLKDLGSRLITTDALNSQYMESDFIQHCHSLGVPYHSQDLTPQKSILLENNLDELNAIDWEKGCYMGQELTSRTKHRGLVRKRLFPVRIQGEGLKTGAEVLCDDKSVGAMRSSHKGLGLALLRLEAFDDFQKRKAPFTCEGSRIEPYCPDWMVV